MPRNKYTPITVIVVVLLTSALVLLFWPKEKPAAPVRVIMDNAGGRVIFAHQTHVEDYGYACADCHHDNIGQASPIACGNCHPVEFGDTFRKEHQKRFANDEACLRCHDEKPTFPLKEEDRPMVENIPLRADAFHQLCIHCHEENGGPGEDACHECHAR
ncbi:cytochrome c3 family protein [Pseudodesulfovibrio sp.]|uniref:cytochrome c3 family protein n=1 Tax=unclassified Pseudodesulfovibrio TaxID=2661612 RepID=UPI003AFF8772